MFLVQFVYFLLVLLQMLAQHGVHVGTLYRTQEPPVPAPEEESVPETEPPPTASPSREKVQKDTARRKRQEDDYSGLFLRRNEISRAFTSGSRMESRS